MTNPWKFDRNSIFVSCGWGRGGQAAQSRTCVLSSGWVAADGRHRVAHVSFVVGVSRRPGGVKSHMCRSCGGMTLIIATIIIVTIHFFFLLKPLWAYTDCDNGQYSLVNTAAYLSNYTTSRARQYERGARMDWILLAGRSAYHKPRKCGQE